jgi:hypothetical protein
MRSQITFSRVPGVQNAGIGREHYGERNIDGYLETHIKACEESEDSNSLTYGP